MTAQLPPSEDRKQQEAPATEERDRKALASEVELNPLSLAGSYFHRLENGEIVWDGIVVGEPQPGVYLLQVRKGLDGLERTEAQVLMPLTKMVAADEGYEFRFYDTQGSMVDAYAEFVTGQLERERY